METEPAAPILGELDRELRALFFVGREPLLASGGLQFDFGTLGIETECLFSVFLVEFDLLLEERRIGGAGNEQRHGREETQRGSPIQVRCHCRSFHSPSQPVAAQRLNSAHHPHQYPKSSDFFFFVGAGFRFFRS